MPFSLGMEHPYGCLPTSNLTSLLSLPLKSFHTCRPQLPSFADPVINTVAIEEFVLRAAQFLNQEIRNRTVRRDIFVQRGLFTLEEIESLLTARRPAQPWAIYYSESGGLGVLDQNSGMGRRKQGVIPCSAVRNHGVAWKFMGEKEDLKIWLATARKEAHEWDMDSDIGHESAHAAFAPVPLFAQEAHLNADAAEFSAVRRVEDLNAGHFGRLAYLFSELAVVTIRGEQRPTQTGLPVPEPRELLALFELSHQLMPRIGFDQALSSFGRLNFPINVKDDVEIFELAAPVIRFLPHITSLTTSFEPPTLDWFRRLATASA